ncbi:NACHT domain-containing protein [Melittangium boletus]|uniref:NACHT domain-containing protein n=1 Tax=Melittangium boletus DSM 14713 TaxID=1294270 RepID=A0A250IEP9_9BACT|nr:NACHT domain-containing protein [Melittangium boletus]ATB30235.1 NACHT domain-containing protein [Melittangium boletus DSM 14713]
MPDAPWWERTPEGTPLLLAFVQVSRDRVAEESLRQRARYIAGVEYVADKVSAAQPLSWREDDILLLVQGEDSHTAIINALSAAEAIRERAMVDLSMTVRLAVHAARVDWTPTREKLAPQDVARCEQLAQAAPLQGIAITEDVYLSLTDAERRRFAPLGKWVHDGLAAYVFPTGLATQATPGAFKPLGNTTHWQAIRRYVNSPEIRRLRYVGFPLQKKQPPSLDIREVFIPPEARRLGNLLPNHVQAARQLHVSIGPSEKKVEAGGGKKGGVPIPREPLARLVRTHKALVVLGDPGAGKTTVLKWLAVLAAGGALAWAERIGTSERLLPLLVSVGRLAQLRSQMDEDCSVAHVLATYFQDREVGDAAELRPFFERTLEADECMLLLDGLDEVQSKERSVVLRWIETFCAQYPRNRFVISTRRVGYSGITLPEGVEVELAEFQDEQIHRYVRAFERACRRWENEGTPDDAGANRNSERLQEALFANPRLTDLARNPFLLSALALIHRAEGRLPRHRVQAYEIFARTLCETWGRARQIVASDIPARDIRYEEEAIPILGELALRMHLEWPTGVAPEDFVIRTLTQAHQEHTGVTPIEAERSAKEFLERAGREVQILLERGAGQWGFLHLTFQEFFTAVGLLSAENFEPVALEHLFNPRWEEIIRLGVGYMALIQKRAQATQRFVRQVLAHEVISPQQHLSTSERKPVYLAALLASEAGDTLPPSLQVEIAKAVMTWNQSVPETVALPLLRELALTEFAERLLDELLSNASSNEETVQEKVLLALGILRGARARQALQLAAKAQNSAIRAQVARSIIMGGDPMDWETLSLLADDRDSRVRSSALAGFISSQDPYRRDEALELLLNNSRAEVLRHVIQIIVSIRTLQPRHEFPSTFKAAAPHFVQHALYRGLSHEDESVRKEAFFLLAMEHERFPDEAHAHSEELERFIQSTLNPSSPFQRPPPVDEERELHERALQGDPGVLTDLAQSFAHRLEGTLRRDMRCDAEAAYDAVIDVLFAYVTMPERYDPRTGRLETYLTQAAKHRVRDRMRSRASEALREENFASVVELWQSPPGDILEDFVEASRAVDRLIQQEHLRDEKDVAFLRLILSGEGSTEKLAEVLGLETDSQEQMRRDVKRHRDRLAKMLERFGKELDDPV